VTDTIEGALIGAAATILVGILGLFVRNSIRKKSVQKSKIRGSKNMNQQAEQSGRNNTLVQNIGTQPAKELPELTLTQHVLSSDGKIFDLTIWIKNLGPTIIVKGISISGKSFYNDGSLILARNDQTALSFRFSSDDIIISSKSENSAKGHIDFRTNAEAHYRQEFEFKREAMEIGLFKPQTLIPGKMYEIKK
jgi:hypothetical protein